MRVAEELGVGRVRHLAVERRRRRRACRRARAAPRRRPSGSRRPCRPSRSVGSSPPGTSKRCGSADDSGLGTSTTMLRIPPSSSIASSGWSSAFPCQFSWFSTSLTPLPLSVCATITVGWPWCGAPPVGAVDLLEVVPVDLDRLPAEGLGPLRVRVEIPAVHRLAALAEPVHVDDRGQVLELVERGVLERLPHRALGHLAVAAQAPDAVREPVEVLAGERHADRDRQPLAERAGGDVDPRDARASGGLPCGCRRRGR